MPIYLAHRTVVESSEEDLEAAFVRAKEAADQMPEVRWIRSYYSAEEGKIYCEYEAPSVEAIVEHARRVGYRSTMPRSCGSWSQGCSRSQNFGQR